MTVGESCGDVEDPVAQGTAILIVLYAVRLGASVESDPTRMCELLVGLPDATVLGVDEADDRVTVVIETRGHHDRCVWGVVKGARTAECRERRSLRPGSVDRRLGGGGTK